MLKILLTLAETVNLTDDQLKSIASEFGNNWPIRCTIPVGVLVSARQELQNILSGPDLETVERSLEAARKDEGSTVDKILADLD